MAWGAGRVVEAEGESVHSTGVVQSSDWEAVCDDIFEGLLSRGVTVERACRRCVAGQCIRGDAGI